MACCCAGVLDPRKLLDSVDALKGLLDLAVFPNRVLSDLSPKRPLPVTLFWVFPNKLPGCVTFVLPKRLGWFGCWGCWVLGNNPIPEVAPVFVEPKRLPGLSPSNDCCWVLPVLPNRLIGWAAFEAVNWLDVDVLPNRLLAVWFVAGALPNGLFVCWFVVDELPVDILPNMLLPAVACGIVFEVFPVKPAPVAGWFIVVLPNIFPPVAGWSVLVLPNKPVLGWAFVFPKGEVPADWFCAFPKMLAPVAEDWFVFPGKIGTNPVCVLSVDPMSTFIPEDWVALLVLVPPKRLFPVVAPVFVVPKRELVGWFCGAFPKSDVCPAGWVFPGIFPAGFCCCVLPKLLCCVFPKALVLAAFGRLSRAPNWDMLWGSSRSANSTSICAVSIRRYYLQSRAWDDTIQTTKSTEFWMPTRHKRVRKIRTVERQDEQKTEYTFTWSHEVQKNLLSPIWT